MPAISVACATASESTLVANPPTSFTLVAIPPMSSTGFGKPLPTICFKDNVLPSYETGQLSSVLAAALRHPYRKC
jgi:hypothetical protein